MTHLTEDDTEWAEHVTDTEYHSGIDEAAATATAGKEQPQ